MTLTASPDWQPWYVGQTFPSIAIPLLVDGNPDDITGIATNYFSLVMRSNASTDRTGTGIIAIVSYNPAVIAYKFSQADVSQAWNGSLFVKVLWPPSFSAADQVIYDPITPFVISPS